MNRNALPRPKLSRRNVLKLLATAGLSATAGYLLLEYAPWLNYDGEADAIRAPLNLTAPAAPMLELVRYATLAANGHNTQPWKFALTDNAIEIHPDYSRHLPVVDPDNRELWISLGCALENLLIAARAAGYAPEVTYPDAEEVIHVRLTADSAQRSPLFDAIPLRQSTRSDYDGQSVKPADFEPVQALPLEPGVGLHFYTTPADLERVLEYVNQGNLSQYADQAYLEELIAWLRFNKREALASLDGLYTGSSGNPEIPRWLGQLFVGGTQPQQQADLDAAKLRSSAGVVVVSSESEDRAAWVRTGQVYERMALAMTSVDVKSAFLNQPVEVADLRSQFQSAMALGAALPQLLVRFGYAAPMPRSLRRPPESVLL